MSAFGEDWEAKRDREEAVEAADAWVSKQANIVHASAGGDGPWGSLHPVGWSYVTGRITAGSVPDWQQRYDVDPNGVARSLAMCVPGLGPQGPAAIQAAAGVATTVPHIAASEPRPPGRRNAVDELRNTHPGLIEAASRGEPPPTLFAEGDQPRTTASGIEPAAIARLPWRARLAAAWERDRLAAFRITQDFGGPDGEDMSQVEFAGHPAVARHIAEVHQWARTSGLAKVDPLSDDEQDALFPPHTSGARS